jgi:hypothetical protein
LKTLTEFSLLSAHAHANSSVFQNNTALQPNQAIIEEDEDEEVVVVTLSSNNIQLLRTSAHTPLLSYTEYNHSFKEWRLI